MTSTEHPFVNPAEGMLAYLVGRTRPELARQIADSGRIETAVIGLGRQGTRHAGLMRDYGTTVSAAVAPGQGGMRAHETIPVYDSVAEMMRAHPRIAAASIWKHYSTAAFAAIEAIEAGIPIVVLISEGIPIRDVRRLVTVAREHQTLLLGPNTPGVIFPPERVKIGMLPDVFYPAEPEPNRYSASGVTICSRSGAILYHMSDALASAGIAQNAVLGVGGDALVGSPFAELVPLAMGFEQTDLVVVAGEIGGSQEERLAEAIQAEPDRFAKPIVALISGRCAPEGKTMGHAGAIVAPGTSYGTFASKRAALQEAGVTVVNSQPDLIAAVREVLGAERRYFLPERYYERMKALWEAPVPVVSWGTTVTRVAPNALAIRGVPLAEIIGRRELLEVTAMLVQGQWPDAEDLAQLETIAVQASRQPVPEIELLSGDDVSKQLAALLLADVGLAGFAGRPIERTAHCLGRVAAAFAHLFDHPLQTDGDFSTVAARAVAGDAASDYQRARMLEAAIVASVDHGVTPPSAQATVLAASVRGAYEVAVASGVMAITDVHGGAGAKAAEFFAQCVERAGDAADDDALLAAMESVIADRMRGGGRVEGLGHRLHTEDPRRDALWALAEQTGVAGPCTAATRLVGEAFATVRGMSLPVNVDGVIGAIVADMGLDPRVAKALFIFGRVAGLSAHYFEEITTQMPMRRIDFARAVYRGP